MILCHYPINVHGVRHDSILDFYNKNINNHLMNGYHRLQTLINRIEALKPHIIVVLQRANYTRLAAEAAYTLENRGSIAFSFKASMASFRASEEAALALLASHNNSYSLPVSSMSSTSALYTPMANSTFYNNSYSSSYSSSSSYLSSSSSSSYSNSSIPSSATAAAPMSTNLAQAMNNQDGVAPMDTSDGVAAMDTSYEENNPNRHFILES
jgi:extradiol dioxygenase family protein